MTNKNKLISKITDFTTKTAQIPGSKSIANRALMISSIANGVSKLSNIPECDDVLAFVDALENLGIKCEKDGDKMQIFGNSGKFENIKNTVLNCKIAGTTSRFLTALASLCKREIVVTGEGKLLERPIKDLCNALLALNVDVKYLKNDGCVPVSVSSSCNFASEVLINGAISSQYTSALLMIAPYFSSGLQLRASSPVSKPYIDLTIDIMGTFGVKVENNEYLSYNIPKSQYTSQDFAIEGDWSSASYFFGISMLTGMKIEISGLKTTSLQGDRRILDIFKQLGAKIEENNNIISLIAPKTIKALKINMENMPDSAMTIICTLAFADGISEISGLSTLKNKETDRLAALHNELQKIGINTEVFTDKIVIYGNSELKLENCVEIETYHDHRMAMCFAMIASRLGNLAILDPKVVSKSMPEFWDICKKIGLNFNVC
ncbi:3-phosphoshikimate 1-carboxyvinyltransferase [Candidatus Deianiraea vastatrix]|uniref:3-phosphoshikimate 1-carboxyvinyltransferase n=1 Tax=Candidatus Deianiraea vastatrix TaxID=2163644 RepID=A0A5B8XDZ8_9RICK|nr:3-phosphoshikimate 1-carboxyvinyltransferase [Candidatus Deianiraea vastatrix]QED23226.1 3-phosphoshikimate 1-carboxyvinyltransferase [Candidatus Deianiraea vastatrix]